MQISFDRRIVTTGHGTIRLFADEAAFSVFVSSRDAKREIVVRRAGEEAARLRAELDRIGYDRLVTGGLSLHAERDQKKSSTFGDGPIIGYVARQNFALFERNFVRLESTLRLLTVWEPAKGVGVEFSRLTWDVTRERRTAGVAEAFGDAYQEAVRRAGSLFAAAGLPLPTVPAFVHETGSGSTYASYPQADYARASYGSQGIIQPRLRAYGYSSNDSRQNDEAEILPVTIQAPEMELSASVTVGWEIEKIVTTAAVPASS